MKKKPSIVADLNIPFLQGALASHANIQYLPASKINRKALVNADALIIRTRTQCNASLLGGTAVKFIATATIGHDHIDQVFCKQAGVSWSNAPGCNASSVMQYMACALASIALHDKKKFNELCLGVIGAGNVGKKVINLAHVLDMKVLVNDPPRERHEGREAYTELPTLLEEADIVSMHMPLNHEGPDKSFHMANDVFFDMMKTGAWFINTARGEVTQTRALKNALRSGKLRGAVIDVWENEPLIDKELLRLAYIATPHIAGYSLDGKANGTAMSVQAVSRFFKLGIDNWFPKKIPAPQNPVIHLKNHNKTKEENIHQLFTHTYDIHADSRRLKSEVENFEAFRDNYPPRREFPAFNVEVLELPNDLASILANLHFRAF